MPLDNGGGRVGSGGVDGSCTRQDKFDRIESRRPPEPFTVGMGELKDLEPKFTGVATCHSIVAADQLEVEVWMATCTRQDKRQGQDSALSLSLSLSLSVRFGLSETVNSV
jgi:hypothetical protein